MIPTGSGPLFSVIIPTYNRAQKVVRAVESVLAQSLADYDVWVIDDGSTDATAERLLPYLDRIHYVAQANSGVAGARNRGIHESAGKFIALLDSDDWWYPQRLASLAEAIRAYPEVGLFYSQWEVVNEAGEQLWVDKSRNVVGSAYYTLLKGDFLAASSAIINRECLDQVGVFDPLMEPCEDWDMWLRISKRYSIHLVPQELLAFEHSAKDKITTNTQRWLDAHDRVINKAFAGDPALSQETRRAVLANIAFVKGRICLQAGGEPEALHWFQQAIAIRPTHLKAHLYLLIFSVSWVRRWLPQPVRTRLRLPAGKG